MSKWDIKCCEHNRCPQRPGWWLSRFANRPWRCAQCGTFWVTVYVPGWMEGIWEWQEIEPDEVAQ